MNNKLLQFQCSEGLQTRQYLAVEMDLSLHNYATPKCSSKFINILIILVLIIFNINFLKANNIINDTDVMFSATLSDSEILFKYVYDTIFYLRGNSIFA